MIKQAVVELARRMGYTVIPTWQLPTFVAVQDLKRRLTLLDIDLLLDVGANSGQYRDLLRQRIGYTGQIVSFEPVPYLARGLAERAASDPKWDVRHLALGAEPTTTHFNIMADTEFSSLHTPRHDDIGIFVESNKVVGQMMVEVSTLDILLPPLLGMHSPRGVFLKLDTQGHDLQILKGASLVLREIAGVQIEMSVRRIYEGAPDFAEVFAFFESCGFVASNIVPSNDGHFPLLVDFDGQFIRQDVAARLSITVTRSH